MIDMQSNNDGTVTCKLCHGVEDITFLKKNIQSHLHDYHAWEIDK